MYPTSSLVYGVDLGEIDDDYINDIEDIVSKFPGVVLEEYGDSASEIGYVLAIENTLPVAIYEACKIGPDLPLTDPSWAAILANVLQAVLATQNVTVKDPTPYWYILSEYGG